MTSQTLESQTWATNSTRRYTTHSPLTFPLSSAIMAAANLLPAPPPVRHASSVSEWLQLLHLSSMEDKFTDYSLDKITTLWDIQLTTVSTIITSTVCITNSLLVTVARGGAIGSS